MVAKALAAWTQEMGKAVPPQTKQTRPVFRALTDKEIASLEQALGKTIDRTFLTHWISQSTVAAVKLAGRPTARQLRDELLRLEREGREWLRKAEEGHAASFFATYLDLPEFIKTTTAFCDRVAGLAQNVDAAVRGHPRTPAALEHFVENMIGIAKRAKVKPSVPSRREDKTSAPGAAKKREKRGPPAFFKFLTTALRLARTLIRASALPDEVKAATISQLKFQSLDALGNLVVERRGRIEDYKETQHGLVERKSERSRR